MPRFAPGKIRQQLEYVLNGLITIFFPKRKHTHPTLVGRKSNDLCNLNA